PDIEEIVYHSFIPSLNDRSALVAVGVIGATVMPHALYIHSWLTKRRLVKDSIEEKREVLRLHRIENIIMLTIAGLINASIMIMSAAAFYGNAQVITIEDAYQTLIPLFGSLAAFVFAITLLISGISSSTLGTITGQAVFEDLLSKKSNPWFRRIITRFVNVIPTAIALLIGLEPLDILVYSQVVLSLLIPLPLIPIILISKNKHIMGEFVNKPITSILAIIFAGVIIAFNVYLLYSL
ncbi:MAG: divalent metal cation transporter, partial [Candidatus Nitrosothermus koennekii]